MTKRLVIKIGTHVITDQDGLPDRQRILHIIDQAARLKQQGHDVILVSSGAMAAGRQLKKLPKRADTVSKRQLWASLGQVRLMNIYSEYLANHQLTGSQVLVSKSDFRDRQHYLNIKNCLETLLEEDIIPIVNENDVVSITELMFTDNDELAGLIASMIDADKLIILSNIDGIYTGPPGEHGSKLIPVIEPGQKNLKQFISTQKSSFGRGGMITKSNIARKVAESGITVYITNGCRANIVEQLIENEKQVPHTKFLAGKKKSNIKKWIAHSEGFEKGEVIVNQGAKEALLSDKATSLLFVGITRIRGSFKRGDIVKIKDEQDRYVGLGMAQYDSDTAVEKIGQENTRPLIHYDYLHLNGDE